MPELIDYAKKLGFKVGVFPIYEYWNDITPKSLIKEINFIKIKVLNFYLFLKYS